jgi:hypothetical protein
VLKLLEKLGFTLMDKSERIHPPNRHRTIFMNRCKILTEACAVEDAFESERVRFFFAAQ